MAVRLSTLSSRQQAGGGAVCAGAGGRETRAPSHPLAGVLREKTSRCVSTGDDSVRRVPRETSPPPERNARPTRGPLRLRTRLLHRPDSYDDQGLTVAR